jgi:hypothetical protein
MSNAPPRLWLTQFAILTTWGLVWLLIPGLSLSLLTGNPVADLSDPAIDQLRMSAPYLVGLAGFTVFAMMTRRTPMRRGFAIIFAFVLGLWSIANWMGISAGLYGPIAPVFAVVPSVLALANVTVAIPKPPGWTRAENAGRSSTKPPAAFALWLVQGLVLFSGASAFFCFPELVLRMISVESGGDVAIHQTRLLGALSIAMALFSFYALRAQRSPAWRAFALFFTVFLSVWTVSISWILVWGSYAAPVLGVLAPGLLFLPMNIYLGRMRGQWDPGDVNRPSDSWSSLDLVAGPLMALSVLRTGRRSSHLMGVGATGKYHPNPKLDPRVPENDFFTEYESKKGVRERPVRMRFANLTELDDAALDVRGCAISLAGNDLDDDTCDLMMNTGSFCPSTNLATFAGFVVSKFLPTSISEKAIRKNLVAREGGVAGLRRAPDSYSGLRYYGQIVRYWTEPEPEGKRHLVRYRCVPAEPEAGEGPSEPETGLPSADDAAHIWLRGRHASDHRPSDYLRNELKTRLLSPNPVRVRMSLEAQFHTPSPGESPEWFNPSVDWDEHTHPWLRLGELRLTNWLPDADTEQLEFDPGNHPISLGIPRATGPLDYRSMGDSEARVVPALQNLRSWMRGTYGMPAFGDVAER